MKALNGENANMFGKKHKPETIEKFIKFRNTIEYKEKDRINGLMFGFTKGSIPWNKGKTNVYSKEVLKQIGSGRRGKPSSFKGKHHSKKAIELLRQAHIGKPGLSGVKNPMYGKHFKHKPETIRKMIIARSHRIFPKKDTKPERMMQIALTLNGIKFEKQKLFNIGKRFHRVDLFVEPNICIEVDGVRWHIQIESIKRDLDQTQQLTIMGYHVIRIRDKDILKNTQNCAEKVIHLINELTNGIRLL